MPGRLPPNCYRRGDVIWGRLVVAGREHRASLRTADPKEAGHRLRAWRLRIERRALGADDPRSFQAAVVRWAAEVLPGAVKPQVARRYLTSIAALDAEFGDAALPDITPARIARFIGRRAGTVSNATIRRDLTALSRLLSAAIAWGWIAENPARTFDRSIIRERRAPMALPSDAALARVLAGCPPPMASILRLLAETGMREMEAVRLETAAVDFARRQITLRHTKSGRVRTLNWRTPGGDAGRVLDGLTPDGPFLLPHRGARPYAAFAQDFGNVMRRVQAAEAAAGRPFVRFRVHDLRHRFAIAWLKNGGDIYRLSRHLGHTSVKTTEGYLRYLTDDELDAIVGTAQEGGGTKGGTATLEKRLKTAQN